MKKVLNYVHKWWKMAISVMVIAIVLTALMWDIMAALFGKEIASLAVVGVWTVIGFKFLVDLNEYLCLGPRQKT
jgi:hypothetical protein